jgi:putative component of membrane protein insertase Oxa1/YidC/SpoIIIJ protein YidD
MVSMATATNPATLSITGMTSAQNWLYPAFPVPQATLAGGASNPAVLSLLSADLLAAGGTSTIDVTVTFKDYGWLTETKNCVQAFGVTKAGQTPPDMSSAQQCVPFTGKPPLQPKPVVVKTVCKKSERYQPERKRCEPVCQKGFDYSAKRNACIQQQPVCKKGTRYQPERKRCEPVCQKGFDYSAKRNACIQQKPDCPEGTVFNPKRNRCQEAVPVCKKPFVYDANSNACVKRVGEEECPRGTISVKGRCIKIPKCPLGSFPVPGTGICVGIGGGGGGNGDENPKGPVGSDNCKDPAGNPRPCP